MINKTKLQDKVEEILTLKIKLANAKREFKLIPDGYSYIITSSESVLDSTCVNFDTAMEELDKWIRDEMASNVCLWTNNPKAYEYVEDYDYSEFVKYASISELQDLSEGKG
jgi:hypothetical protein